MGLEVNMLLAREHPLLVLSTEFRDICKPLELFGIYHFTYQKQFNDGRRISLCNKPEWIYDYYNLELYQSSLFEKKPSDCEAGFNIWMGEYDLDVYRHGRDYYKTDNSITISEPSENACEHYLFSTRVGDQQSIQYLVNNMDVLYHFILYLKDHGAAIFKAAEKQGILLKPGLESSPEEFIFSGSKKTYKDKEDAKKMFFNQTPIHRYVFESGKHMSIKLTQREIQCLKYLLEDKTAPETAKLMNISRRTVESYLDNIKTKLDCNTKLELMQKVKAHRFLSAI